MATKTSSPRPRLDRRWSMDTPKTVPVPDPREGYVFQLKALHEAHQQSSNITSVSERYPGMISDEKSGRIWQSPQKRSSSPQFGSRLMPHLSSRCRSSSMDLGSLANNRVRQHASQDITVVPEDNEICTQIATTSTSSSSATATSGRPRKLTAPPSSSGSKAIVFLRQRSSSLPRLLPPIIDVDNQEGSKRCSSASDQPEHERQRRLQQSILVAKELQKFVCKNAADVAAILPLPIPTALVRQTASNSSSWQSASLDSARPVVASLGKLHALMLGVQQMAPALYQDFVLSLGLEGNQAALEGAKTLLSQLQEDKDLDLDEDEVERELRHLISAKTCLPFDLICHGDPRTSTTTTTTTRTSSSCRLGHLSNALVGSPLVDVCLIIHELMVNHALAVDELERQLPILMKSYFDSFSKICRALRVDFKHLCTQQQMLEDLRQHLRAGLVLGHVLEEKRRGIRKDLNPIKKALKDLQNSSEISFG